MDIIESRKISYNDNIIRKAEGTIQGNKHTLNMHKEGLLYIISLYDNKTRIKDKQYLFRSRTTKHFTKLTKKYNFVVLIPSQPEPKTPKTKKRGSKV